MSAKKKAADEKKQLLSRLLLSIKSCQSRFGSRTELATESDELIGRLCSSFEDVFSNGVKKPPSTQSSLWQMTENLVPGLRSAEVLSFWPLLKSQLSKHEAERFLLLHNVRTDLGRGRAWLRAALNEKSLERYIHVILSSDNLDAFYEESSFLRDEELSSILPQTAAGLGSILFALTIDNPELDKPKAVQMESAVEDPIAKSMPELAEVADEAFKPLLNAASSLIDQSKLRKGKKKKKIPTAYVLFDEANSSASSCVNTPTEKQAPSYFSRVGVQPNPVPNLTVIPTSPKEIPKISDTLRNESEKSLGILSSSVKSTDNISLYSDSSDRLDVENLVLGVISASERLKPVRSEEASGSLLNFDDDLERTDDLIPVPSYTNEDEQLIDVFENPDSASSLKFLKEEVGESAQEIQSSHSADDRVQKLKKILDRELEMVTSLKAQLAEERRASNDGMKMLEAKIEALTKENELLKHQLKKYIGAVQLLKESGNVRRMSMEQGEVDLLEITGQSTEQSTEAVEYERKLIQVAEMHGELMEFNAYLQVVLQRKDHALRTLRAELEDLRGPLASAFDDDSSSIDSNFNFPEAGGGRRISFHRQLTNNERILINIWIPSAFITGNANDLHHVYQIFLRIKDTEWNVFRRYSQFHNFHRDMKKLDSVIGTFYFPPKKHIGNKDTKFVDERRRKLQEYLRKVINHTLQTNSLLASHPDKNLLVSILPFFGETTQPQKQKRSRSRTRNLFFRGSESAEQQFLQAPAHPQYTGL